MSSQSEKNLRDAVDAEAGADVNAFDEFGTMPLHVAVKNRDAELARELLRRGADILGVSKQGWSVMHYVVISSDYTDQSDSWRRTSDLEFLELLKENGADVNVRSPKLGRTPLHLAATMGYRHISKFLLDHGADVNVKDGFETTALFALRVCMASLSVF